MFNVVYRVPGRSGCSRWKDFLESLLSLRISVIHMRMHKQLNNYACQPKVIRISCETIRQMANLVYTCTNVVLLQTTCNAMES